MLNGMLRLPMTIESLQHYVRSDEVLGKLDVHWGRNSFRENELKAKVKHATSLSDLSLRETFRETSLKPRLHQTLCNRIQVSRTSNLYQI